MFESMTSDGARRRVGHVEAGPQGIERHLEAVNAVVEAAKHLCEFQAMKPRRGTVAGAGLPGILFACGSLLAWWRRKRKAV